MQKMQKILLLLLVIATVELSAACTKEQRTKLIMNDVSQSEIDSLCGATSSDKAPTIIINNTNTNTNNNSNDNPSASNNSNQFTEKSAVELRVGTIFGSGTASLVIDGVASGDDADTSTGGFKVQLGMSTVKNNMYSYYFVGYQTTETLFGTSTVPTEGRAFLFGGESASGGKDLKFVFGGEFGLGSETAGNDEYSVFIAEPYVGLRYNMTDSLSLNVKVGYRAKVMSADLYIDSSSYTNTLEIYDFGIVSGVTLGFTFN